MSDAKQILQQVQELLQELEVYERYNAETKTKAEKLYAEYQKKKFGYIEYELRLKNAFKGKTQEEWKKQFEIDTLSIFTRLDYFLSQALYVIHKDETYKELKISGPEKPKEAAEQKKSAFKDFFPQIRVFDLETELNKIRGKQTIRQFLQIGKKPEIDHRLDELKERLNRPHKKQQRQPGFFSAFLAFLASLLKGIFSKGTVKPAQKKPEKPQTQSIIEQIKTLFTPQKKSIFVEEITEMERRQKIGKAEDKKLESGAIGFFSGIQYIKKLVEKLILNSFQKKQEPLIGETSVPAHLKRLREMRQKLYEEEGQAGIQSTLLSEEAKRIKKILEAQKQVVYKGSYIGVIANLSVKKISLFLMEKFPSFFSRFYNSLRAANIKMLSNTYINIMMFSTIAVSLITFAIMPFILFAFDYPIYAIFLRTIMFSIIAGITCAIIFYMYPSMKIKERKTSIMTNMPFAINHMASVSTSGVPPSMMFQLISTSHEYGEIAVEIKKIVDFVEIFGYDLLSASKAVALITPSPQFKEFLEGMVSTIESGGDLESFLRQKADEATLTYQLERQKYNQTIGTYSDLYTGVLIAAPLFFVAALAMVNMLGGTIGGMKVDTVMALGAYVAIPFMNIAFIIFLQMSQPDV